MHNRIILIFTAMIMLLVLVGCGGGGGGGEESTMSGTTPINLNDRDSIYGTYQVTFVSVNCTNGESFTTSNDRVDEFRAFVGYGYSNFYRDLYLEADGTVLIDVADVRPYDQVESNNYTSTTNMIDDYNFTETIYNVPVSYYYCDYTYRYKKISDSIVTNYFRVVRSRTTDVSEGYIFFDEAELPNFNLEFGNLFNRFSN
ncbi:MAG: hypothetical protein C0602_05985 [Denitrovibrio sp.]|nr:MAG: hypothetical protein C0602_05985 [Denitrovibrio sp.]